MLLLLCGGAWTPPGPRRLSLLLVLCLVVLGLVVMELLLLVLWQWW
jgi:hypothetical protein